MTSPKAAFKLYHNGTNYEVARYMNGVWEVQSRRYDSEISAARAIKGMAKAQYFDASGEPIETKPASA